MKYVFPFELYGQDAVLVEIDKAIVPIISGALEKFLTRYVWETDTDYQAGYNAIAKVMASMSGNTLAELIRIQSATYRMLDEALNGRVYTLEAGQVVPAISDVPSSKVEVTASLRANIERLWQLAENAHTAALFGVSANGAGAPLEETGSWASRLLAVQGTTGGFFGLGATPVQLSDLLQAGRVNNAADQGLINNGIEEVLGAVGSGGSVASALSNILGIGADAATDGGLAAVQIAAIVASQASSALLAQQVDRLVRAIDGGGLVSPATSDNNVLRLLDTGLFAQGVAIDSNGPKFNATRYLMSRWGETDQTSPLEYLTRIVAGIGAPVSGQTANQQLNAIERALYNNIGGVNWTAAGLLNSIRVSLLALEGSSPSGVINPDSVLGRQLALLECICEAVSGAPAPNVPGPRWDVCGTAGFNEGEPYATIELDMSTGQTIDMTSAINLESIALRLAQFPYAPSQRFIRRNEPGGSLYCLQLQKYEGDVGTYSIDTVQVEPNGTPAAATGWSMVVPPNEGQTTRIEDNDALGNAYGMRVTVSRTIGSSSELVPYTGPAPRLYILRRILE